MAIDFSSLFAGFGTTEWALILIIFVLFVLSIKKVFRILMNALWIVIAAVLFPIFANRVLGLPVPADTDSILLMATAGLGLYLIYILAKSIYSLLNFAEKIGKKVVPKISKDQSRGKDKKSKETREHSAIEKPLRGQPLPKNYFTQPSKTKTEKEMFKDYVIIEDKEVPQDFAPEKKLVRLGKDKYVELGRAEPEIEDMSDLSDEAAEEEFVDLTKRPKMERIPEKKFKEKKAKKGKKK